MLQLRIGVSFRERNIFSWRNQLNGTRKDTKRSCSPSPFIKTGSVMSLVTNASSIYLKNLE